MPKPKTFPVVLDVLVLVLADAIADVTVVVMVILDK